jgi:2-polyprenyl-3-methyl-5-hydroxy-6-metoxy-1,4-benzoquinol methylase
MTVEENAVFYQTEYNQGFTTEMPSDSELQTLLTNCFKGSEKDYSEYIKMLAALGCKPGQCVLDFGCSWGYGSWQLKQAGYKVIGFEISRPRCGYAQEKLGIDAHTEHEDIGGDHTFDIFFSAHVLEHVPSVADTIAFARQKLKPGGLFIAFTPNGSSDFKNAHPSSWCKLWGLVHPNFIDDVYYQRTFPGCLLASSPYNINDISARLKTNDLTTPKLDGFELLIATRLD